MIDWDSLVLAPCESVFGEPVTFMPAAGGSYAVAGIFDEAFMHVDVSGETPITTEMPVLGIRSSTFPVMPRQGDRILIASRARTYTVREVRPDGHGSAKLMLNEAP